MRKLGVTKWYECKNCKAPFGVGDCGQFNGTGKCDSCGAPIGGAHGGGRGWTEAKPSAERLKWTLPISACTAGR